MKDSITVVATTTLVATRMLLLVTELTPLHPRWHGTPSKFACGVSCRARARKYPVLEKDCAPKVGSSASRRVRQFQSSTNIYDFFRGTGGDYVENRSSQRSSADTYSRTGQSSVQSTRHSV